MSEVHIWQPFNMGKIYIFLIKWALKWSLICKPRRSKKVEFCRLNAARPDKTEMFNIQYLRTHLLDYLQQCKLLMRCCCCPGVCVHGCALFLAPALTGATIQPLGLKIIQTVNGNKLWRSCRLEQILEILWNFKMTEAELMSQSERRFICQSFRQREKKRRHPPWEGQQRKCLTK